MHVSPFCLKLLLSFVVGGGWITLATVTAERFGSKVGGVIGGLPSTIVVALSFIAWTQGAETAFLTTTALPMSFALNTLFLVAYVALVKKGLVYGILGALLVWLVLQGLLVVFRLDSFTLALVGWLVIPFISYYLVTHRFGVRPHDRVRMRYSALQLAGRAVFSGAMVALAVVVSKLGGPIWGSIFSAFPAVYISTLIITSRSVGIAFSRSLIAPLMVSSTANCVVFVTAFRHAILPLGLVAAVLVAYGFSLVSAYLTYRFVSARLA